MSRLTDFLALKQTGLKERGLQHLRSFPEDYDELIEQAFGEQQPQSWHAAYILSEFLKREPQRTEDFHARIPQIIKALPHFSSPGQKRDFLKILLLLPIPESEMGKLVTVGFHFILDPKSDVCAIVHSMQLIYNCSLHFHDLQRELLLTMDEIENRASTGVKSRINKLRKKINTNRLNNH